MLENSNKYDYLVRNYGFYGIFQTLLNYADIKIAICHASRTFLRAGVPYSDTLKNKGFSIILEEGVIVL